MKKVLIALACMVAMSFIGCKSTGDTKPPQNVIMATNVMTSPPKNPVKGEKYLFFLHNINVEIDGPDSWSEHFGKYNAYTEIVNNFASQNYNIISEVRSKGTIPKYYAKRISQEIIELINTGVPGENIAVIGHSRGAFMALMIRSRVKNPEVSIVVMAGCAKEGTNSVAGTNPRAGFNKFLNKRAYKMQGRILSIFDSNDEWFGSCEEAFNASDNIQSSEIILNTGEGHGLFYAPNPIWVTPVLDWIGW